MQSPAAWPGSALDKAGCEVPPLPGYLQSLREGLLFLLMPPGLQPRAGGSERGLVMGAAWVGALQLFWADPKRLRHVQKPGSSC